MRSIRGVVCAGALALWGGSPAGARPPLEVHPEHHRTWSDSAGWLDWSRARFHATYLSGTVAGESIGAIRLGASAGRPRDGAAYANIDSTDFGVNLVPRGGGGGELYGYAWGESIGWIDFGGGALATPPDPARLERAAGPGSPWCLRGWAWSESLGWISLGEVGDAQFVALRCPADMNADGLLDADDVLSFQLRWTLGDPAADMNGDGLLDAADFLAFQAELARGC